MQKRQQPDHNLLLGNAHQVTGMQSTSVALVINPTAILTESDTTLGSTETDGLQHTTTIITKSTSNCHFGMYTSQT